MQANELGVRQCRNRFASKPAVKRAAAPEEDSEKDSGPAEDSKKYGDVLQQLRGLGDLANIALRMVPGHIGAVVHVGE